MIVSYQTLEKTIYAEFIIAIVIILVTYLLHPYYKFKEQRYKNHQLSLFNVLNQALQANTDLPYSTIPKTWQKSEIIFPLLDEFDKNPSTHWQYLRKNIFIHLLMPHIKTLSASFFMTQRIYASQILAEYYIEENFSLIKQQLLNDSPLIQLNAIRAAIQSNDEVLINAAIDAISRHRRINQSLYINLFAHAAKNIFAIIYTRVKAETDPFIKTTCYRLLTFDPAPQPLTTDLTSSHKDLLIASLKFYIYSQPQEIILKLSTFLSHEYWEVRSLIVNHLGDTKKYVPIMQKLLSDKASLVRINTAKALFQCGKVGQDILLAQHPQTDLYAYEAAQHVLNIYMPRV